MSIHIRAEIRCDECGGTTANACRDFDEKLTLSDIASLRRNSVEWTRARKTPAGSLRDLCPLCTAAAQAAKRRI